MTAISLLLKQLYNKVIHCIEILNMKNTAGHNAGPYLLFSKYLLLVCAAPALADDSVVLDKLVVEGVAVPGNGLVTPQNAPQAASVIARPAIEQKNSQNNIYQAMDMVPGVNTYSYDATGLFGGNIRMRGFNSDQIGVSIDGAPMNDAGNFAVYPSELVDLENLEQIEVIQGGNNTDTPMTGATGGSIGMRTSNPTDQARFRVQQTYGAFNAYKTFLRADTGYLGDKRFKAFLSVSKAEADKFKGYGSADREHLDFKGVLNLSPGNSITGGFLYNELFNNNFRTLNKQQIQTLGRNADYGIIPPNPNGSIPSDRFYNLSVNPYRNYLATLQGRFELMPNLKLDIDPYYNYGYGTGGDELRALSEGVPPLKAGDINGDGDITDTVLVYSGFLTETQRPGVTARLHSQLANHKLMAGYWFDYSHHRRTMPAVRFDAAGNAADPWLEDSSQFILRQDGSVYQNRNMLTETTSQSFFAQDDISILNNDLLVSLGLRYMTVQRDFNNYASESYPNNGSAKAGYARPLPNVGIRYQLDDQQQIFANRAENFKIPPDSVFYSSFAPNTKVKAVNVKEELSTNWELGYRYYQNDLSLTATLFYIDYRNRIALAYDPLNDIRTNYNVGDSTTKGIELESAWRFLPNWSIYGSFSYTHNRMEQNLQTQLTTNGPVVTLLTAGKAFPDVPEYLAGAALQYRNGPWSANLSAKYTGHRYATLVNDESLSGYTLVSFDSSYRLPSTGWFRDPMVKFNVYNLLDEDYLNLTAASGSSFTVTASQNPSYYVGAPRSFSVTLSTDF